MPGDPANTDFRLNPLQNSNPLEPNLEIASGFSWVGTFDIHGNAPASFKAYGSSGPVKMLGNMISDVQVFEENAFMGSRLLLATIRISNGHSSDTYDVFLEKNFA